MPSTEKLPFLEAQSLTKRFGSLTVLNNVSLSIYPGEVVGLAGRNGAGKTLLIRTLAGLQSPDNGRLQINGKVQSWPFQAASLGIGIIHQEPKLTEHFDITSNIFLGQELKYSFMGRTINLINDRKMYEEARRILAQLDIKFPSLHEKVANLSSDDRQLVSLAQGIVTSANLRLIDDPVSLLSTPYQKKLLTLIETWQQSGTAVLFADQNLDHLFAVSDRIIVLREGNVTANLRTDETTREEIVAALVGTSDRQQHTPVLWALDSYYKAKQQAETLRHNQQLLEKDLADRDTINQQLLHQLSEQVQALDSANMALQDAQRRLLTQREQERKHLSRELHDDTIQDLLSLNYQLEEMSVLAHGNEPLITELDDVRHAIRQVVASVRRICGNLRPPTIDSLGLNAALQSYGQSWSDRTGISIHMSTGKNLGRLPETIELSVFRIVQEGLNNVWKHAEATHVDIRLSFGSRRMLSITIADNGRGVPDNFDLSLLSTSGHFGLLGISERVALLGGRLRIQNGNNGGLVLTVEVPHPRVTQHTAELF